MGNFSLKAKVIAYGATLRGRLRRPKFWLVILSAVLLFSLIINVAALIGVRSVIEPPASGQFAKLLQKAPIEKPTNVTQTLFEHTVDELSGGVVPVLLFPNMSQFCGDDSAFELNIAACVDRFDATYIAVSEELTLDWNKSYQSAQEEGLDAEAELINQWERHVAAHEFGHILQYNYRTITLPFQENFENGLLHRSNEDMAECYAQLQQPLTDTVAKKEGDYVDLSFYGFKQKQRFALCTEDQLQVIRDWLAAIPYPEANRVEIPIAD